MVVTLCTPSSTRLNSLIQCLMVLKRRCTEQEGDRFEVKRQFNAVREFRRFLSDEDAVNGFFEPFFRRVVREEVEGLVQLFCLPSSRSISDINSSEVRRLQLQFVNKPSPVYTASSVKSEDGGQLQVVIIEAGSNTKITAGPLSSIKIEIVVLDGDFGKDSEGDWTEEEFNYHVVRQREGKRPLVIGELIVPMRNGVGCIGEIMFTDNSSWRRSRKFRLGARIVPNSSSEIRIREARSEAFIVLDHRGESYKKHHPPLLDDEVWRLEKIGKNGKFHTRLASYGIHYVKDFLQAYGTNPSILRGMLGGGISNRIWNKIIGHATACVSSPTSQKDIAENTKQQAYQNSNYIEPLYDTMLVGPSRPLSYSQVGQLSDPCLDMQNLHLFYTHQGQLEEPQNSNNLRSTSFTCFDVNQMDTYHWVQNGSSALTLPIPLSTANDVSYFDASPSSSLSPFTTTLAQGSSFIFTSSSSIGKPKAQWCKIRAAIKWGILVRRKLAARRMAQFLHQVRSS